MKEQNIEKLFKDKLSNFDVDVNPNAWANISKGLQSAVPSPAGSAASKTMGWLGYSGLFLAVSTAVILAVIYLPEKKSTSENIVAQNTPAVSHNNIDVPAQPVVATHVNLPVIDNAPVTKAVAENKPVEKNTVVVAPKEIAKEETTPEKKQPVDNAVSVPAPPVQVNEVKQMEKNIPDVHPAMTENNSLKETAPVVETNFETPDKGFDFAYEPVENTAREQESRWDFVFYIPNVITPNGDGINDDFKPMGLNFKDFQLIIRDHKGNEIFHSNDINDTWDGKLKDGNPAPAGNYTYVITVKDLNNFEHPQTGLLLLKR